MSSAEILTEPTIPPAPRPSILAPLRERNFLLVWIGETISYLGDQFYFVALPWLALHLAGEDKGLALGTIAAVAGIPRAIFMLVGGAFTDRFSPRNVMLISDTLRLILTALLTALVVTNTIQLWMLYVIGFAFGLVDAFFFPAQMAIVPRLVRREQLEAGNALTQIATQLISFIGPAVAGLTIAYLSSAANADELAASVGAQTGGLGAAFAFDTLTFAVAAVALWLVRDTKRQQNSESTETRTETQPRPSIWSSIAEGIRIIWGDPILRTLILLTMTINFFFTGTMGVGLPLMASTRFAEGTVALGALSSAFGGGALFGAVLGGSLPKPRSIGITAMILIGIAGAALALLGQVSQLAPGVLIAAVMGLTIGYVNVVMVAWLQKRTAPEVMGRAMSLVMLGSVGIGPISNAVAGVLADVNLSLMFAGAGILLVIVSGLSYFNREMRAVQ